MQKAETGFRLCLSVFQIGFSSQLALDKVNVRKILLDFDSCACFL